jgi:hypothetical protein
VVIEKEKDNLKLEAEEIPNQIMEAAALKKDTDSLVLEVKQIQ